MRREPARRERAETFDVSGMARQDDTAGLIEALRRHIARIEQSLPQFGRRPARGQPWTLGIPAIDAHLAAHGLARTGLHDVAPHSHGDLPAAMGFALALALRRLADPAESRPLLWCRLAKEEREHGRLYGHGLEALGLARRRFVSLALNRPASLLWTVEEALRSRALALVVADADPRHVDLTVARRLSLAAQAGKAAGILVFGRIMPAATASHSRWTIASLPSRAPPDDRQAPGNPVWNVQLTRARGGRPGVWSVEWQHAPHRFDLVSGIRRGAIHPFTDESPEAAAVPPSALRAG